MDRMAPLTATMRFCAPMEPEPSTRNRMSLPCLFSLTFSLRSSLFSTMARSPCSRQAWYGAAARMLATNAMSSILPRGMRYPMHLPPVSSDIVLFCFPDRDLLTLSSEGM